MCMWMPTAAVAAEAHPTCVISHDNLRGKSLVWWPRLFDQSGRGEVGEARIPAPLRQRSPALPSSLQRSASPKSGGELQPWVALGCPPDLGKGEAEGGRKTGKTEERGKKKRGRRDIGNRFGRVVLSLLARARARECA
ncbi:hypothetical protein QR680_015147 [Steinernema hermaphroditum]|uniref:Uncharacterized protein n=1 Tax=Steinernema hermaphroditum TaxID=289476 RepID=A0AA39IBB1_9BILA|nr:hypothetical protein QR680_015147 [Steinernema hermaphroditum]